MEVGKESLSSEKPVDAFDMSLKHRHRNHENLFMTKQTCTCSRLTVKTVKRSARLNFTIKTPE